MCRISPIDSSTYSVSGLSPANSRPSPIEIHAPDS